MRMIEVRRGLRNVAYAQNDVNDEPSPARQTLKGPFVHVIHGPAAPHIENNLR